MKRPAYRIPAGVLLVCLGGLLCVVDALVLSVDATAFLARWFGAPAGTARGLIEQIAVDAAGPRLFVTFPAWLRWVCLFAGAALLALEGLARRRK